MNRFICVGIMALSFLTAYSEIHADLSDGLVGYFPFDDGNGDSLAEVTGNGNAGELFNFEGDNSEWVEGKIGGALSFDGIDDYVIAPEMPIADTALSVSIWGYANDAPTWGSLVKNWGGSLVGQFHFGLGQGAADTLNIFVTQDDQTAFNAGTDVDPIELEEWEHYAFVADPATEMVSLYRNGEVVDEQSYDGTFTTSPNSDAIGIGVKTDNSGEFSDGGNPGYWDGLLDDLGIWHRALTEEEVVGIYTAGLDGQPILGGGPNLPGDFDSSGALDAADIDLLSAEVLTGNNTASFDLTGDNVVDSKDRFEWIEVLSNTFVGDANLDGEFNSTDFVVVFTASEYEDGVAGNSSWATGDWNGDTEFDSSDFVAAFTAAGYESGPRVGVQSVPEPSAIMPSIIGSVILLMIRRR